MDDARAACLGIALCGGIGHAAFQRLIREFGSVDRAFYAPSQLLTYVLTEKQLHQLITFRKTFSYHSSLRMLAKNDVWFMSIFDEIYPPLLRNIKDPPICLFGRGELSRMNFSDDTCIGVVGTRKPTEYGKEVAQWCGQVYAENDLVVVSGLAYGIDSITQQAAVSNNGRTIAVLGTNITSPYPSQNEDLYETIIKKNGIVISEYPPGASITRAAFVLRNRIIVGLSENLVVVEGGEKSGSLISATYAAENGRDVFAVPGHITSEQSVGPHILLRQGAQLMQHPLDVIGEQKMSLRKKSVPVGNLSPEETKIIELLRTQSKIGDTIAQQINLPTSIVLSLLTTLEIRGIIHKTNDGRYAL